MRLILYAIFTISSFFAHAHAECLSSEVVTSISRQVRVGRGDVKSSLCNPNSPTYKILDALIFIKTLKLAKGEVEAPFNQNILGNNFWEYFTKRANLIVNHSATGFCRKVVAYVEYEKKNGIIHICPSFYDGDMGVLDRAALLLHEVRHFDGFDHVKCTRGEFKSESGSCDQSLDQRGSYAVNLEMLSKVALAAENVSPQLRYKAKRDALMGIGNHINEMPFAQGLAALYLVEQSGQASFFDGKTFYPAPSVKDGLIISREHSLNVFPIDKSDAFTLDPFSRLLSIWPAEGDLSVKYNSLSVNLRSKVLDIINLDKVGCLIFDNGLACENLENNEEISVEFNGEIMAAFSAPEIGEKGRDSIFVKDAAGAFFRIQFFNGKKFKVTAVSRPDLNGFVRIVMFNGLRLALTQEGEILRNQNGRWLPYSVLAGRRFTHMTRPLSYWNSYFVR